MDYIDVIPIFDGAEKDVFRFLEGCETLIVNFSGAESYEKSISEPIEKLLMDMITSRLRGAAKELFEKHDSLNFSELQKLVENEFIKENSDVKLYKVFAEVTPKSYEMYDDFGCRIEAVKKELVAKLKDENFAIRRLKTTMYEKKALNYFKSYMPEDVVVTLIFLNTKTMMGAISCIFRWRRTQITRYMCFPRQNEEESEEESDDGNYDSHDEYEDGEDMDIEEHNFLGSPLSARETLASSSNYILAGSGSHLRKIFADCNMCRDLVPYVPPPFVLQPLNETFNPYHNWHSELRASYGISSFDNARGLIRDLDQLRIFQHFGRESFWS